MAKKPKGAKKSVGVLAPKKPSLLSKAVSAVKSYAKNVVGGAKIVGSAIKNVTVPKGSQSANALQAVSTGQNLVNLKNSAAIPAKGNVNLSGAQVAQNQINAKNKANFNPVGDGGNIGASENTGNLNDSALRAGQFGVTAPPTRTKLTVPKNYLGKASAPTDPSLIDSSVESLNFSGDSGSSFSSLGSGGGGNIMGAGTAGAGSAVAGAQTSATQEIQTAKELQAEQAKLTAEKQQKINDSFLKKIFNEQEDSIDDLADKREDLEEQYQIQQKTAEINSLQESLSKMEVEVQNQVAMANDKLGSMNFINNQVQQIERNASPALNRLRADINFKTGILTQNEGLIEKAMEQATQESRDRVNNMKWFYTEHYDKVVSKLDKKYDDALKSSIKEAEDEHDYQIKLWEWKRDTIIDYGLEGLTPNDSEGVISRAASKKQAIENNLSIQNTTSLINERGDGGSSSTNLTPAQEKTYEAYKSQISTYKSKEEAIEELEKVKFGVIKAIGQAGYDALIQDIAGSTLRDKSLSWWDKLLGRE